MADRGYLKIEDIEACETAGIDYVPRPQRDPSVREGLFRKDEFRYDPTSDSYRCPAGHILQAYSSSLLRGLKKINYANKAAARTARSVRNARGTAFAWYRGSRTRPCWTGWMPA